MIGAKRVKRSGGVVQYECQFVVKLFAGGQGQDAQAVELGGELSQSLRGGGGWSFSHLRVTSRRKEQAEE